MNMSQIELVIPALWADAGLPEVAWIPGGLRGPGSNPKAASSVKGDHLKLKTWVEKCGKGASGEELHLLDFSTFPRAISQSTQIMSSSETAKNIWKKRTNWLLQTQTCLWRKSGERGDTLRKAGSATWVLKVSGQQIERCQQKVLGLNKLNGVSSQLNFIAQLWWIHLSQSRSWISIWYVWSFRPLFHKNDRALRGDRQQGQWNFLWRR